MAQVGTDIEAYCGKCRMELMHIVVACKGEKVARVECKTCKGQHAYRHVPSSEPKKAAKRAPAAGKARATAGRARPSAFEEATRGRDLSRARKYEISALFAQGDVIDHHSFGLGVVTRILSDAKVQVVFDGSERVLIHARA